MEREYTIVYKVDAGNATAQLNALAAALNGVTTAATGSQQALQGMPAPANSAGASIQGLGVQMLAMRAGMAVINEAREALDAYGEAAKRAHKEEMGAARTGLEQRTAASEYANLLQKDSPDDEVMSRLFGLAQGAGMKFGQALEFGEQFLGSTPAGRQKGHSTEDIEKLLEVEAARFSRRVGLDPATGGDVAGVISQYVDLTKDEQGRPLSAEQGMVKAMGQLGGLAYGLNEGRGKMTPLMRSALSAAASMVGDEEGSPFRDLAELGAVAGVGSTVAKTGASAGRVVQQAGRMIQKAKLSDDPDIQALGIKDTDDFATSLEKLMPKIVGAGGDRFLIEQGLTAATERDALRGLARNADVIRQRRAKAAELAGGGRDVIAADAAFVGSDVGQFGVAQAQHQFGTYARGRAEQPLEIAREAAKGRMQANEESITATFGDWLENKVNPSIWFGETDATQRRIDQNVFRDLESRAGAAGIDLAKRFPQWVKRVDRGAEGQQGLFQTEAGMDPNNLASMLGALNPELNAKGLGFGGENAGKMDQVADKFAEAVREFAAAQKGNGAAGGGMPAIGGAGVVPRRM